MKIIYAYKQEVHSELLSAIIYGDMSFQDYYTGETEKELTAEYERIIKQINAIAYFIEAYVEKVSHVESIEDNENSSESWSSTLKVIFLVDDNCKFEVCDCFENWLWWQKKGLMYTTTGYGKKIPTTYMIEHRGEDIIVEDINPYLGLAVINTEFVINA